MQHCASRLHLLLVVTLWAAVFSSAPNGHAQQPRGRDVESLRSALLRLSPTVSRQDAARAAARAHKTTGDLKREYRVVGPPPFHNFLVNAGIRQRGLCHQWTRDLMAQLGGLNLKTLDLHWGIARAGTLREHNTVVVTAKRQPFGTGIVLDPWRHSGRLYVGPVARDRYPWSEDVRDCLCERKQQHDAATARAPRVTSSGAAASRSAQPTR